MIFCKFCGGKSQKQYLYLSCKHLSCLACAFLRTEFSTQQIQCCDASTRIDEGAMEKIIKSKRYMKGFEDEAGDREKASYIGLLQENSNIKQVGDWRQDVREKDGVNEVANANFNGNSGDKKERLEIKKVISEYRKDISEEEQYELETILMRHLEKSKKYFEAQRQALKDRETQAIKRMVSIFENEKKSLERPITQATLEKFNLNLEKKLDLISVPQRPGISQRQNSQNVSRLEDKPQKQSQQSYDHILKRLEINQQRMRQKIQKHLQVLY